MIPPIQIDISEIVESFSLSKAQTDALMKRTLDGVVNEFTSIWENNIGKELGSSRNEYKRAIFVERIGEFTTVIGITSRDSKLPLMLEDGASPFDMKEGFANSGKRKLKKDGGWYLTIPFRASTPDAIGESAAFSGKLPPEIHKIAKAKSKTNPGLGLKKSELPSKFAKVSTRAKISTAKQEYAAYTHKSSIYEGVAKRTFKNESSYGSFRRVSDNSDDNSWVHPGFTAKKLMDKSLTELRVQDVVTAITDEFLENI